MKIENDLGKDDIKRLVIRIAIPSMLAQFVNVLYSVVDRMYIGNIAEIGEKALAGVGVCGPIVTMISAFASLVGIGGSPLMSIKMGEGSEKEAKKILANSFLMLAVISVITTAGALLLKNNLLMWFGASETIFPYANQYITIYLLGTIFALMAVGMNQFIICQGFAKVGMKSVIIGAVLNIILDPIFIFVFHMGVRGAAIATVLSQVASCCFVLWFLFGKTGPIRITFSGYSMKIMRRVLLMGFTPFIIIAIDNVMIIAMNAVLQTYGKGGEGDMLITCATIVQSFMLVVTMPLSGITGGTQTILAYNYGAGQTKRVLTAQRYIILLCVAYMGLMFIVARVGGSLFVRLFTSSPQLAEKAVWAIRICTMALIPLGVQYEIVDGFTALGCVKFALSLSFIRKLAYFVPLFLLPAFFGAESVFFAETISDLLGPLTSVVIYCMFIRKIMSRREAALN